MSRYDALSTFVTWYRIYVHATGQEAKDCPEKESILECPPGSAVS